MQYIGSKNKIAKYILPIMLAERKRGQYWVEPFVGGANMIDKVNRKRIGNDSNEYLISLLIAIRDGYVPPNNISRDQYYEIKSNIHDFPKELVGFVGFLCSFGGRWWEGYVFNKRGDNYAEQGVEFSQGSYYEMEIPKNIIIYCDPPYYNTVKYKDDFDHDIFWEWCKKKEKERKRRSHSFHIGIQCTRRI